MAQRMGARHRDGRTGRLCKMSRAQRIHVVACDETSMALNICEGCLRAFRFGERPDRDRAAHIVTCVAYRDLIVERKLMAQACDDGREYEPSNEFAREGGV